MAYMSKILVTGGAGFIGSNLVDKLVALGHQVVIIDDLSSGNKDYLNPQAKFYQVDICSLEIESIFASEKPDYVFHLAAHIFVPRSITNPELDNKINILGALNILQNAYKQKIKKFIFTSSGGAVYGDTDQIPTSENILCQPISPYGIHKLAFEKYLNYFYKIFGFKYTALRPANVYGPRQFKEGEAGVISIFVDNVVADKKCLVTGTGTQTRDFVYVDDVVEALVKASQSDFVGEVNIATGREVNLLQVIESLDKISGKKIAVEHIAERVGEQMRSCLDASLAKKVLNWQAQVDLEQGLKKTLAWAQKR